MKNELYYKYLCEARATGRASHTFQTVSHDTARALCDVNGWDLIRVYEPGTDSDRPPQAKAKGDGPLSPKQRTALVTEASKTYKMLSDLGLASGGFDNWRHEQVKACVNRAGLTECTNWHYKKLLNHFRALRGGKAPKPAPARRWSNEGGDTPERREQIILQIARELGHHARRVENPQTPADIAAAAAATLKGGLITEDYMMAIARGKNPSATLYESGCLITLTAAKLEQLLWTLRNRIAAREGRGKTANRNKNQ
jgi:hypothetical protein